MKTRTLTTWSSKWLVAAMLTAGSSHPATAGPDAAPSRTETPSNPAAPTPATIPEIRPDRSPPAQPQLPATPLSFWAAQIAKLARAGIDDDIILSFLDNVGTVNLGADQIIYLTDHGVSRNVITAMLQHDFEISSGWRPLATVTTPMQQTVFSPPPGLEVSTAAKPDPTAAAGVQSNEPPAAAPPVHDNPPPENISAAKTEPGTIFVNFPVWEYAVAQSDSGGTFHPLHQPAPTPTKHTYSVREPYPVPITDPIVVIGAAGMEPNVVRIEPFH